MRMLRLAFIAVTAMVSFPSIVAAQECSNDQGWTITFCRVQADSVELKVGIGGLASSHTNWQVISGAAGRTITLPPQFRYAKEVWLYARAIPDDEDVELCIKFNGVAKQHMDFDEDEEHEVSRDDSENDCNC